MKRRSFSCLAVLALLLAAWPNAAPAQPPPGCASKTVDVQKMPVVVSVCMTGFVGIVDDLVTANGKSVSHGLTLGSYGGKPGGYEATGSQNATAVAPAASRPSPAPTGREGNGGAASAADTVDLTELGIPKEALRITFSVSGFTASIKSVVLLPEGTEL